MDVCSALLVAAVPLIPALSEVAGAAACAKLKAFNAITNISTFSLEPNL